MKYIDLSHPISKKTVTYPSDPDIIIRKEKNIKDHNTLLHSFSMGTHTGTHLDSPAHIFHKGKTIDKFPIDSFTGKAIKVDKNNFCDLELLGIELDGLVYDTGWYKNFNKPELFYGPNRPSLPYGIIDFVINNKLKFFGCDLPSVDKSGSKKKIIHNSLLKKDIIIYESLANLNQIPLLQPFRYFGFPLPVKDLDGSPVRVIAEI